MQTKRTVCLLNDSFPPQIDGVSNAVTNYADIMLKNYYNPVVITPDYPDANDALFSYPVLRYPSVDARKTTGYMAGIPFSPTAIKRLMGENVQLLHSHCPVISTLMARSLRQVFDAPVVLTYHTKFDIDVANAVRGKHLQAGSLMAIKENISACDEIWVVSDGTGESLRNIGYHGDYVVMPNGVDVPRMRVSDALIEETVKGYDLPAGTPVYLFVGRMRWYKGIRLLLDALAILHRQSLDFRMVMIGDGLDREEIESYSEECGISDKCIFTGAIHDRDALRAWYCRANLFLFPSTYDTNGLVVREAAACSLASVLIRGSCAAEGVVDQTNGFLVDENAESLAACLTELHGKFDYLSSVGNTAGEQLYMSWNDSVLNALNRYEIVIDRYKSGYYPKKKQPIEAFMKMNGELMEALSKVRRDRRFL